VNWVRRVRPPHLVFDPGPLIAKVGRDALDAILAATSWLSLNAAEAAALTGKDDPATAAAAARRRISGPRTRTRKAPRSMGRKPDI
jgi:sugar/nucleoside kinase (ribokinase family)